MRAGEARLVIKPPFPPSKGLWSKPTVINNVETLMNIPPIILNGSKWFREVGTEQSKGTKVFSVSGDVEKPGVYELILGSSLQELVIDMAWGQEHQNGAGRGATGGIIPYSMILHSFGLRNGFGFGGGDRIQRKQRDS